MAEKLYFTFLIDCEATQPAVNDAALGERSSLAFAESLERRGLRGTFHVIPSDAEASPKLYRELRGRGHEIGLHVHPAADGFGEFLGVYGPDDQRMILGQAKRRVEQALGFEPGSMCVGYGSVNDFTYSVLYDLGFRHGTTSIPTRILPECASVHGGSPIDMHYAHRYNRALVGDLDYVECPQTLDPESRMWGGKHPQDLRVELVDAKNHFYTIKKSIDRQVASNVPIKHIRGATHNIFEFGDAKDFRRQTLEGILDHTFRLAEQAGVQVIGATTQEVADAYRAKVPLGAGATQLTLDRRGYEKGAGKSVAGSAR